MDTAVRTLRGTFRLSSLVTRWDEWVAAKAAVPTEHQRMKRIAATGLWLYAFWYAGSMIAAVLGLPDVVGPMLGVSAAGLAWSDPRRAIWNRRITSSAAAA